MCRLIPPPGFALSFHPSPVPFDKDANCKLPLPYNGGCDGILIGFCQSTPIPGTARTQRLTEPGSGQLGADHDMAVFGTLTPSFTHTDSNLYSHRQKPLLTQTAMLATQIAVFAT